MINSVRDTVHDFLEKNNRGWLKPERFNNYAYLAQLEIFESYFYDYAKWVTLQNNRQAGSGYANIPKVLREKLDIFHKVEDLTYTTNSYPPLADTYRIMDVFYGGEFVDEVSKRRQVLLSKSNMTAPDTDYPVYVRVADNIWVYPITIITGVSCSYIRKPAVPKWTYTVIAGNPVFNISAGDYQDFEIHPSDENELVMKILGYAGVSVREKDIVSYSESKQLQNKQKESKFKV